VNTYIEHGLTALGDPTRLAIFHLLAKNPHAVNELAAGLPVSRPAVSQHLRVLKQARLVRDRKAGTRRIYELDPQGIALLRDHFAHLWDQALSAFKRFAEEEHLKEQKEQKEQKNVPRSRTNGSGKANDPRRRTN
jgi:DNA-binding transcriptional ArsR family regulator